MFRVRENCKIADFSTFKIGGRVRFFCEVKNDKDLFESIKLAEKKKISWRILGGGSNVIFPDGVLNCFLIKLISGKIKVPGNRIVADAGAKLDKVVKLAVKNNLVGLEKLAGIPGTIGGAIVGNAGAYGHSISDVVEKVEIFSAEGGSVSGGDLVKNKKWFSNKDCKFGYRDSIFKKKPFIILRAVLKMKYGDKKKLAEISKNIIKTRNGKYPKEIKCAGSFFKNILVKDVSSKSLALVDEKKIVNGKIPAGYLLEGVGARGLRINGAKVADFHANFMVNNGKAKASDIRRLAEILKKKVKKKFGIGLREEIRYF